MPNPFNTRISLIDTKPRVKGKLTSTPSPEFRAKYMYVAREISWESSTHEISSPPKFAVNNWLWCFYSYIRWRTQELGFFLYSQFSWYLASRSGDLLNIQLHGFKQILPNFWDWRILRGSWADFTDLMQ